MVAKKRVSEAVDRVQRLKKAAGIYRKEAASKKYDFGYMSEMREQWEERGKSRQMEHERAIDAFRQWLKTDNARAICSLLGASGRYINLGFEYRKEDSCRVYILCGTGLGAIMCPPNTPNPGTSDCALIDNSKLPMFVSLIDVITVRDVFDYRKKRGVTTDVDEMVRWINSAADELANSKLNK